jgi:hypothetical protein
MKVTKSIFLAMLLLVPLSVFAVDFSKVPLPDDLNIVPPDSSLPEDIKALSGKRGGEWLTAASKPTGQYAVLVVEKILNEKTAVIVYGVSESPNSKGGFWRTEAEIVSVDKKVMLEWMSKVTTRKLSFRLKGDKLECETTIHYPRWGEQKNYITMSRIQ